MVPGKPTPMPAAADALPGRTAQMPVNGGPLRQWPSSQRSLIPEGLEVAMFGMGCFWGAERKFWQLEGVFTTAAGYAAGSLRI